MRYDLVYVHRYYEVLASLVSTTSICFQGKSKSRKCHIIKTPKHVVIDHKPKMLRQKLLFKMKKTSQNEFIRISRNFKDMKMIDHNIR